jgi:hypothetical protein
MMLSTLLAGFLTLAVSDTLTEIPCEQCHSPQAWMPLAAPMAFNHDTTDFPLKGRHQSAECIQCHEGPRVEDIHKFDRISKDCQACHMDIHSGDFNLDCSTCHNSQTWDMANWRGNHSRTMFPLEGVHAQLACEDCHGVKTTAFSGVLTTECAACHYQAFSRAVDEAEHGSNDNCILCHNTRAFVPADMSHHDLLFPIYTGSHRGTWSSCEAECHINPDDYTDFSCGLNGVCHEHDQSKMDRKHSGEVSNYKYESRRCYNCHAGGSGGD